ncbi:MAG: thiamine-phosphate kinase, partial [Methylobacteriaceae bacterium]|nr:thiamine-phosphate kinase [Methylobacteriaceae bacterium]
MTAPLSEDDLIARYFAPIAGEGAFALKDDAARYAPPPGCDLVLTCDALVAGVHFFADDPPDAIARKALRVNLSDLAAKGADPAGFLLSLALPADWREDDLAAFARGLGEDARAYGCPLLGGDTVKTPGPLTLSVTAFGTTPAGRMVKRFAVQAGDALYVTGTIGDAALGLALRREAGLAPRLTPQHRDALRERYLLPRPRLSSARAMRAHARAGMDVSDGLVGDLTKMLRASGVGARVELPRGPLSDAARAASCVDAAMVGVRGP